MHVGEDGVKLKRAHAYTRVKAVVSLRARTVARGGKTIIRLRARAHLRVGKAMVSLACTWWFKHSFSESNNA